MAKCYMAKSCSLDSCGLVITFFAQFILLLFLNPSKILELPLLCLSCLSGLFPLRVWSHYWGGLHSSKTYSYSKCYMWIYVYESNMCVFNIYAHNLPQAIVLILLLKFHVTRRIILNLISKYLKTASKRKNSFVKLKYSLIYYSISPHALSYWFRIQKFSGLTQPLSQRLKNKNFSWFTFLSNSFSLLMLFMSIFSEKGKKQHFFTNRFNWFL